MTTTLPDGLYQVTAKHLCAGFVVRAGRVVDCAPMLALAHPQPAENDPHTRS